MEMTKGTNCFIVLLQGLNQIIHIKNIALVHSKHSISTNDYYPTQFLFLIRNIKLPIFAYLSIAKSTHSIYIPQPRFITPSHK